MNSKSGRLYVVATPIGNLADMTYRAVDILRDADLILAEDTRHAGILLAHYQIKGTVWSCHEHNERKQVDAVLQRLQQGDQVALISDAGTPLISDPGYPLVSRVVDAGFDVSPIPGPCAAIAALSASGLPTDRFCFEGFVPAKAGQRNAFLDRIAAESRPVIVYESSHRIVDCMDAIAERMGAARLVAVGREITKRFETFYRGPAGEVAGVIRSERDNQRGEFVVLIAGADNPDAEQRDAERLMDLLLPHLPLKPASQIAAAFTGANRKALYQRGLES